MPRSSRTSSGAPCGHDARQRRGVARHPTGPPRRGGSTRRTANPVRRPTSVRRARNRRSDGPYERDRLISAPKPGPARRGALAVAWTTKMWLAPSPRSRSAASDRLPAPGPSGGAAPTNVSSSAQRGAAAAAAAASRGSSGRRHTASSSRSRRSGWTGRPITGVVRNQHRGLTAAGRSPVQHRSCASERAPASERPTTAQTVHSVAGERHISCRRRGARPRTAATPRRASGGSTP